jgi:hypothetical protein
MSTGPVRELEAYVDRRRLAAIMGVSESTITRLLRDGMPSDTWGMTRTRRYLPSTCIAWARAREVGDTMRPPDGHNTDVQPQSKE